MLISLKRSGLNITLLLNKKLKSRYLLKKKLYFTMLIQLFLLLILTNHAPFPVRIKEHTKVSTLVNKSYIRTPKPHEKFKVEPSIAMVKDILEESVDGHVIYFCEEAARIAKPDKKDKHIPVVGMPVISVK